MNLYLISQEKIRGWGTYTSAVVAAPSEEAAREIHPAGPKGWERDPHQTEWVSPENVKVELVGLALEGIEEGRIVCLDYHDG